tara:strand:- start:74 stop:319 length:246 start_codon:yes stop_codon:yes gene_type:complete
MIDDVKNEREVWWASTKEMDVVVNGKEYTVRVVEDSNEASIIYFNTKTRSWDSLYEGQSNGDVDIENTNEIFIAWENGELC